MSVISKDIRMENDGQLFIKNGDFQIWESNQEHAVALVKANKNDWKEFPDRGVEIDKHLNSPSTNTLELRQIIASEFVKDGFNIQDLAVSYNNETLRTSVKTNAKRNR